MRRKLMWTALMCAPALNAQDSPEDVSRSCKPPTFSIARTGKKC